MRAIEHALRFLTKAGADILFGVPGGTVNPLYDAVQDIPELKVMISRHETSAAYTAMAYAQTTKKLAVVVGCSGPGASNLMTGVAAAMREGIPMVVLTGQVRVDRMGLLGAQEASPWTMDLAGAFKHVTKLSLVTHRPELLTEDLRQALRVAFTPPYGPVHLAIPLDVQMAEVDLPIPDPKIPAPARGLTVQDQEITKQFLQGPGVIYMGSGVKKAGACEEAGRLAYRLGWPVVTTPAGKGAYPETDYLGAGVFGLSGTKMAQAVLAKAPRVLVLGSSLGELGTQNWGPIFEGKQVLQIDYDPLAIGRHYQPDRAIVADLRLALNQLATVSDRHVWEFPERIPEDTTPLMAQHLLSLRKLTDPNCRLVSDIGEHMTWALRYWKTRYHDDFSIAINYGGMASGLSMALGFAAAEPKRQVVCLLGDGSFAMHGAEIMTALQYGLNVRFVVVNNAGYGMVDWGHQLQYGRSHPDFRHPRYNVTQVARAMGVPAFQLGSLEDWAKPEVEKIFKIVGPSLLELVVPADAVPPMADRVRYLKGE